MRRIVHAWIAGAFALALAAPAAAESFLWEVTSLTNRVYLYGTVHAGKRDWYPLAPAVENALADSSFLVVEADITDTTAMQKSAGSMTYAPPDTLKNHVPPEQYARMLKLLPRYGLAESQVASMKPFMAVSLLVFAEWARSGFVPGYGVDGYLIRKAVAEAKPVVEIEGVETQIRLMDSLTDQQVQELYKGTIDALEEDLTTEQIKGLVAAWQAGDSQGLLDIARRYNEKVAGASEFEEKFIWQRHGDMVKKIEAWLAEPRKRYFIAVGALHLVGPRGLVELLRKRGYLVRQL
ncbi:MAG: TraB/GumN family protein [Burkholderiales bacterium]|nr:TraB/GumN family protein [Burkholderiales bacterium]